MKVSLNWLKEYININLSPEEVGEILTDIGLEVEGMEQVESLPGGLRGVVVGHVVECGQHPNADRLSVTKVDIGNEAGDFLNIVCGAPNVAQGQKVMVATIGTTLYPTNSEEPLTLKKGKIRGEVSEGMICAADELGIGADHSGIMVLPDETKIGTLASDYFNIETDYVYEIGLTPNRSDATNHLGVAKDLGAYLKINHDYQDGVKVPDIAGFGNDDNSLPVDVIVENSEACPRYVGLTLKGITVGESPDWLKNRLGAIGVRPINNMVDATNFILHELGQPLHAFDLNEVKDNKIIVKTLPEGTKFNSLDEVERELNAEDLMICNGAEEGMCIGGVFGGIKSGVKDDTTDIFLESAHFNAKWIRRTSMRHNLRTDAAKVFEKGSDPNISVYALKRAAMLMKELGGGTISSEIVDLYPNPVSRAEIEVRFAQINRLIGIDIPKETLLRIFDALEMEILKEDEKAIVVAVPTNKSDVTREADVIEEILRIYGYNKVPIPEQVKTSMNIAPKPDPNEVRNAIGDYLAASGFNEMMGLSLSQSRYYKEVLPGLSAEGMVYINNTSSVQLDIMRPDMLVSGLEAIVHNQNRQQSDLQLFEFGRTYHMGPEGPEEAEHLSLFITGERYAESWINNRKGDADFYTIKALVNNVMARLGLDGYQESVIKDEVFAYGVKYHRGSNTLVQFGKIQPKLAKEMAIRGGVFYADIHWDSIMKAIRKHKIEYKEVNKFPSMRRDLALVIDNSVKFSDIVAIARKHGKKLITDINLFDVYENAEQLGEGKKSYAVSFIFENESKTLKDKEVDKVINKLIADYESKLGASIRR